MTEMQQKLLQLAKDLLKICESLNDGLLKDEERKKRIEKLKKRLEELEK